MGIYQNRDNIQKFLDDLQGLIYSGIPDIGGDPFTGLPWPGTVDPAANAKFTAARNLILRRDPLGLDLDGDGIELVAATGAVLFDHNSDSIKTGTGWAKSDDGFLVRDLNGNGAIDTGRELFGVDTIKSNGGLASDGFDALRDVDSNGDGFITSADAIYADLRVWRDLDQSGVSTANELFTLADLGITSISTTGTSTGPQAGQLINNNRVALSTTFTQNGTAHTVGAIDLEANNFFTEFPPQVVDDSGNPVAITAQAQALPQMNGSGMVRNMRAAASLNSDFAAALQTFAATTTRDGQRGELDDLISKWAQTSSFASGGLLAATAFNASITYVLPAGVTETSYKNMINVLEAFNGSRFYGNNTGGPRPAGFALQSVTEPTTGNVTYHYIVSPPAQQLAFLQQAYDALKESVYSALVVQTRLKPYLDNIELVIDETGVRFDASASIALAQTKANTDPCNAVADLIDLHKKAIATVRAVGWEPYLTLAGVLEATPVTPQLQSLLAYEHVVSIGASDANYTVTDAHGSAVVGNSQNNVLIGSSGVDELYGGAGNDTITGSYLNNTYIFNRGDGQDTLTNQSHPYYSGYTDVLKFGTGIAAADVTTLRSGENLVFKLNGSTDQITVNNWFPSGSYQIEEIRFSNGVLWSNRPGEHVGDRKPRPSSSHHTSRPASYRNRNLQLHHSGRHF